MKISLMSFSWILRGTGMLLLLPAIFPSVLLRLLPGLEPRHFQFFLFGGALLFITGAVVYHIARHKEKVEREKRMRDQGEDE